MSKIILRCAAVSLAAGIWLNAARGGEKRDPVAYVGGDVPRTGVYAVASDRITLENIYLVAGGDAARADEFVIHLTRVGVDGRPHTAVLPFALVRGHPSLNFKVRADDKITFQAAPQ